MALESKINYIEISNNTDIFHNTNLPPYATISFVEIDSTGSVIIPIMFSAEINEIQVVVDSYIKKGAISNISFEYDNALVPKIINQNDKQINISDMFGIRSINVRIKNVVYFKTIAFNIFGTNVIHNYDFNSSLIFIKDGVNLVNKIKDDVSLSNFENKKTKFNKILLRGERFRREKEDDLYTRAHLAIKKFIRCGQYHWSTCEIQILKKKLYILNRERNDIFDEIGCAAGVLNTEYMCSYYVDAMRNYETKFKKLLQIETLLKEEDASVIHCYFKRLNLISGVALVKTFIDFNDETSGYSETHNKQSVHTHDDCVNFHIESASDSSIKISEQSKTFIKFENFRNVNSIIVCVKNVSHFNSIMFDIFRYDDATKHIKYYNTIKFVKNIKGNGFTEKVNILDHYKMSHQ